MARRRANGEGCITKEPSGRYRVIVSIWTGGKRKRITRTAWKHADAVAILAKLRQESSGGALANVARLTVELFLQTWLADVVGQEAAFAANTLDSYRRAVTKHLVPRIGQLKLTDLSPVHVQNMLAAMSRDEVGSRTRQNAFAVLKTAMSNAQDLGLIADNPCRRIKRPAHQQEEIQPFTLDEAKLILKETAGTRWHAMLMLALTAGMRQGELLGLEWEAIDWKAGRIRVTQQAIEISGRKQLSKPKTKASIRTADITPDAVSALRDHRAILLTDGLAAGPLVFPAPEGGLESRGNFRTRVWQPLLLHLAIEPRGFHHTRHTYATLALGAGVPVTTVSKQLGHASVSTTLNIYSHVLDTHKTEATAVVARLFG